MLARWLRVIPTPHFLSEGKRALLLAQAGSSKLSFQVGPSELEKFAADYLKNGLKRMAGVSHQRFAAGEVGVPLFLGSIYDGVLGAQLKNRLDGEDLHLLANDSTSQAYVLKVDATPGTAAIVIAAAAPQGALNGVMTLLQLLHQHAGRVSAPEIHIRDYPDFKHRAAADWLLFNEISRWGYDWGDGRGAFVERVKRKLDFCLRYKINMVYFDGFSWNPHRFPGYAEMMRDLNRFARQRGIKLVFGGYGMGYGASGLDSEAAYGPAFQNRRSYPDGEIYQCMGWEGQGRSREMGTCLSNQSLEQLKSENLKEFVRAVHPGALYIHHLDSGTYSASEEIWRNRCQECRRRWPNDSFKEEDGAVAAFAAWYDRVCQAVFSVQVEDYVAGRDCTVILVSPCYSGYRESDADWDNAVLFWTRVSNRMTHHRSVQVGLREQLLRHDNNRRRIEQMASALTHGGSGPGIHVIAFGGADRFKNDHLFVSTAVMNGIYQGAEAVYNCCGHVHQEPLQMLNAEYCWNTRPGFQDVPEESPIAMERFQAYVRGELRPAPIFGAGGFLEESCRRLYGDTAAQRLKRVFDLRSPEGLTPVAVAFGSVDKSLPTRVGNLTSQKAEELSNEWNGRLKVTEAALTEVKAALKAKDLPEGLVPSAVEGAAEDLEWLRKGLEMGIAFARVLQDLYATLAPQQGRRAPPKAFGARTVRNLRRLQDLLQEASPEEMVCPLGGDVRVWWECFEALKEAVAKPPASLLQPPPAQQQWW